MVLAALYMHVNAKQESIIFLSAVTFALPPLPAHLAGSGGKARACAGMSTSGHIALLRQQNLATV